MAIICRDDYSSLINKAILKKASYYEHYLRALPFFNTLPNWIVKKLAGTIFVQNFLRSQYVYKDGDEVERVYVVFEGEFEESKTFQLKADLSGNIHIDKTDNIGFTECLEKINNTTTKDIDFDPSVSSEPCSPRSPLKYIKMPSGEKNVKTRTLCAGGIFGIDEPINNIKIRQSSIKCISPKATIYGIRAEAFQKYIKDRDIEKEIKDISVKKQQEAVKSIDNISKFIPIKLPMIDILKPKSKIMPLDIEEKKEVKKKVKIREDNQTLEKMKKINPSFSNESPYQCFDSKYIRGELEPLSAIQLILTKPIPTLPPIKRIESDSRNLKLKVNKTNENRKLKKQLSSPDIDESLLPKMRRKITMDAKTPQLFVTSDNAGVDADASPSSRTVASPPRRKSNISDNRNVLVSENLSCVASEMVEQYKALNNGSAVVNKLDIGIVINQLIQNNKYLQNIIGSLKSTQKKCSRNIKKSKHNLYRFKTHL